MPNYYNADWNIADDVSSDKYSIRLWCGDSVYLQNGTELNIVGMTYTNQSLVEKKKSSAY
jgi:fibronectin type 3 domain-containing protein